MPKGSKTSSQSATRSATRFGGRAMLGAGSSEGLHGYAVTHSGFVAAMQVISDSGSIAFVEQRTGADLDVVGHLSLARAGAQFVTGTVHPEPEELERGKSATWWSRHRLRDGHDCVHGANLGFTLSAYDRVGGFKPMASGEDVGLATACTQKVSCKPPHRSRWSPLAASAGVPPRVSRDTCTPSVPEATMSSIQPAPPP